MTITTPTRNSELRTRNPELGTLNMENGRMRQRVNMIGRSLLVGIGLLYFSLSTNVASAAAIISINPGAVSVAPSNEDITAGYRFTVSDNAIEVTKLGYLIGRGVQDNSPTTDVGLWRVSDQTQLAVITVSQTSVDIVDDFKYGTLVTPVELQANTQYVIAANRGGGEWLYDSPGVTSGSGVTYDTAAVAGFAAGGGTQSPLLYPNITGGIWPSRDAAFGANAQYTIIPEPASFTLLALFAVSLTNRAGPGASRRRK